MTISTIRHAHTTYNGERRYAGTRDVPLSTEGIREASLAASVVAKGNFDVVVTSDLKRAWQTAELLVGKGVPIVRTRLCRERDFGVMEGLTWDEVQELQPPVLMISVGNDLHTVNPRNAEPFEQVWDRAKAFRRFLFSKYRESNVLVVSHGVFLQMFHGVLRGLSCIESLAVYPANLELVRFKFVKERLVEEKTLKVGQSTPRRW